MTLEKLQNILEAVLLSAEHPMSVLQLDDIFSGDEDRPTRDEIRKALHELGDEYEKRGFELKQVSSGFRIQVKQEFAAWVGRLWEEKPARYTRALLETMALIAYRQPVTRGEIEEVRGVSVSSNIIRTLQEREWIKVLGHKDVPGKPALYGTTREFLDYFNLKSLDDLPSLAEIKDLDQIYPELALEDQAANEAEAANDAETADQSAEEKLENDADINAETENDGVDTAEDAMAADADSNNEVIDEETIAQETSAEAVVDAEAVDTESVNASDEDYDDMDETESVEKSAAGA